jgi:hypothetical protein
MFALFCYESAELWDVLFEPWFIDGFSMHAKETVTMALEAMVTETAAVAAMATAMAAMAIAMAAVVAMATATATVAVAVAAAVAAMATAMAAATMAQQSTKRRRRRRQLWRRRLQMRTQWRVVGGSSLHKSVEEIDNHQYYLIKNTLYHSFADDFMGGVLLSHKHSTSCVTPCYASYINRNTYMDLGLSTVPKT